jgi:aspartate aminotransferase-like enzyme
MEGALRNLFAPGGKILSICNGKFGHMFANIAEACDLEVERVFEDWLQPVDLDQIDRALEKDPSIKGVTVIHSDTSTAVANPIADIGRIVRRHDRLLIVDCISSLAAMEFKLDEWQVDVAVTGSQKGLMSPAGLSFVAVGKRAWAAVEKGAKPGYYVDFKGIKKIYDEKRETPGSTPVSLVRSVNEALEMIFEEGPENVYHRHAVISGAIKNSLQAMGLSLLPVGNVDRSHSVTLFKVPDGIKPETIREMARDKYGILVTMAAGQFDINKTALRVGHLGLVSAREAVLIISVLELILLELGAVAKPGKGLEACHATFKSAGW